MGSPASTHSFCIFPLIGGLFREFPICLQEPGLQVSKPPTQTTNSVCVSFVPHGWYSTDFPLPPKCLALGSLQEGVQGRRFSLWHGRSQIRNSRGSRVPMGNRAGLGFPDTFLLTTGFPYQGSTFSLPQGRLPRNGSLPRS